MPVILIGFMGTGKSTVGRLLAESLNQSFCDLDDLIEKEAGMTIPAYFDTYGAKAFRQLEQDLLKKAINEYDILSTGGGTPTILANQEVIQAATGLTIKLDAPIDEIRSRIGDDANRPIFKKLSRQAFDELKQQRDTMYNQASDMSIDTNQRHPQEIADEIKARIFQNIDELNYASL
ncbi:shikimate kinase [Holzapfeliella sp. He02]|uniref:Shikimate kinase n=1 Tax=Holzapfeliella saturejae TaxID=3082953 RepID=A0ABU8SEU0_9LACO